MDPILERYQALEDKVSAYTPNLDTQRLFAAFTYADAEHHGQLRKSGEPYIIHPLAVADIVADLGLDVDSVIAALLHDCIEDTNATHDEIAKKFGAPVAALVEGVTKLTRVQYVSKEEEQMENLRKMLMAMAQDIRVILIKICDRLHNMRTMEYQSPKKQREKSLETMEIYAPLAHRLGMQKLKWELEDLSLRYLDPVGYKEIEEEMAKRSAAHEEFLASIQLRIQQRLEQEGVGPLLAELRAIDPDSAARLHPSDEKRILRALEVWYETGETITQHDRRTRQQPPRYQAAYIGLSFQNRAQLRRRIDLRVDEMVRQGLLEEVQALLAAGLPPTATAWQAIGYKQFLAAADGRCTVAEAVEEIKLRSRQYAKRQLTWLRRNPDIHWILWGEEPNFPQGLQNATEYLTALGLR